MSCPRRPGKECNKFMCGSSVNGVCIEKIENTNKEEMLDYLLSTGLYEKGSKKHPYENLYYEKRMIGTDKTVPIKDLVERFIKVDKEYKGRQWNIQQILTNINMIVPVEDREFQTPYKTNFKRRNIL